MNGIYNTCYQLIAENIFGGVATGSYEELVTILVSTIGSLFIVAIPFIVVYFVIKLIFSVFEKMWG